MARIRMLSEDLIGKIAAGEVVERPAAAIKELVENSLDAGAKHISVEIMEGGITSLRVSDDGCGIDESDIRMAFERHATSKIRNPQDLDSLGTLGFRGEALASIAAVGRVTMTTRTADRESGIRIQNEGGQITDITEIACAPGTSILVKDLFYNVPVRRGFLKKPVTEANAVTDLMAHLILSRPDVSFRYVNGNRMIYHSSGDGKISSAVLAVYGSQVARTLRAVEGTEGGIRLKGYVGIGENARNNRSGEYFFINGRMLRSPLLSGAVEDACRERVMIGKYPVCMLYLQMAPENVNVNVHPNKMEVRFRFDQTVRETVFSQVYDALQDRDALERPVEMPLMKPLAKEPLPEISPEEGKRILEKPRNAVVFTDGNVPDIQMREKPAPIYRTIEGRNAPAEEKTAWPAPEKLPAPLTAKSQEAGAQEGRQAWIPAGTAESASSLNGAQSGTMNPSASLNGAPVGTTASAASLNGAAAGAAAPAAALNGAPVGTIASAASLNGAAAGATASAASLHGDPEQNAEADSHSGYSGTLSGAAAAETAPALTGFLRAQDGREGEQAEQIGGLADALPQPMKIFGAVFDTFILIEYADHLLLVDQHAVHERLLFERMMKQYETASIGQELLVPYIVSLTQREMAVLEENRKLLEELGLRVDQFSQSEVAIRSVPVLLGENESIAFLHEAIDELERGKIPGADRKRAAILQQACKHAVKGGEHLTEEVLRSLVEEMIDQKVTPTCPHGRPLVVSISHRELDKKFKRIQ